MTITEGSQATKHKRIFVAKPSLVELTALEAELANLLRKGLQCNAEDIFGSLSAVIPNFRQYRREQAG